MGTDGDVQIFINFFLVIAVLHLVAVSIGNGIHVPGYRRIITAITRMAVIVFKIRIGKDVLPFFGIGGKPQTDSVCRQVFPQPRRVCRHFRPQRYRNNA